MAITQREYTISAFWNSDDLLNTLQTALADVGFFGASQSNTILTFTNSAGTTIAGEKGKRYLVRQSATSGTGVYSTWDVVRNASTGAVATVTLVNGGENYAAAQTLTIAGTSIGGASPADDITVTVSTVSGAQGNTSTWYDRDTATPYTWAVAGVDLDKTKKLGQTFYSFHIPANPTTSPVLYIRAGASFQSSTNVFNGVAGLDYFSVNTPNSTTQQTFSMTVAKSNATPLKLITYQSGIDSNFVVFQFADVQKYGDVYRDPFILSKYNTAYQPWSLDDCFTGAIYSIGKINTINTSDAQVFITTALAPVGKRQGEYGYAAPTQGTYAQYRGLFGVYESTWGKRISNVNATYPGIYSLPLHNLIHTSADYNPVITGIPICNVMIPAPYFIPADFGIVEVIGTNVNTYGDLIGVGATTKWKIIQFGNNQEAGAVTMTATTAAKLPSSIPVGSYIAFVAKTVD